MKKILVASPNPCYHTGYGNQCLHFFKMFKDEYELYFFDIFLKLDETVNHTTQEKIISNIKRYYKEDYLLNNCKVFGSKLARQNDTDFVEHLWNDFKIVCELENIDILFCIYDTFTMKEKPLDLLLNVEIIWWTPIHNDPDPDYNYIVNVDKFICPSMWGKNVLIKKYINCYYVPHVLEYYTVDDEQRKKEYREKNNIPLDSFCILVVARNSKFHERKNFQAIYDTFILFKNSIAQSKKNKNVHLIIHSNLHKGFNMDIFLNDKSITFSSIDEIMLDLSDLYLSSDVLLCMSKSEGFGLPIVEAQLCGLPVVSTNCTSIRENVINGYLIDCIPDDGQNNYGWSNPSVNDAVNCLTKIYDRDENLKIINSNIAREILHNKMNMLTVKNKLQQVIEHKLEEKIAALFYIVTDDYEKTQEIIETYKFRHKYLYLISDNKSYLDKITIPDEVYTLSVVLDTYAENKNAELFLNTSICYINLLTQKLINKTTIINYNNTSFVNYNSYLNSNIMIDNIQLGEYIFRKHLKKCIPFLVNKSNRYIKKINDCTRSLLFIDDRCDSRIEVQILNMLNFTTEDIGFQIMCKDNNYEFILNIVERNGLENVCITKINQDINTVDKISSFMFSEEFFKNVVTEKVFIFQLDSLLLRPLDNKFWDYDWIGARWGNTIFPPYKYLSGGSGGFNIRNIKKCYSVAKKINFNYSEFIIKENMNNYYEDVIYCFLLSKEENIKLPLDYDSDYFSSESIIMPSLNMYGFHKVYNYITTDLLKKILNIHLHYYQLRNNIITTDIEN